MQKYIWNSYQSTTGKKYNFACCSSFSEEWGSCIAERPVIGMKGRSVISHYASGHNLITSCSQKRSLSLVFNRTKFVTFWWGGEEEGYVFGWSSIENNITSKVIFWRELSVCIRYTLATCQLTNSSTLFKITMRVSVKRQCLKWAQAVRQSKHDRKPSSLSLVKPVESHFFVRFWKCEQYGISASWRLLKGCRFRQKLTFFTAHFRLLPSSVSSRDFSDGKYLHGNVSGQMEVYDLILCVNRVRFSCNQ